MKESRANYKYVSITPATFVATALVFDRLRVLLRRPSRVLGKTEVLMAVAYLVQHCTKEDSDRLKLLVDNVRKSWDRMNNDEIEWFSEFWPEARPDGPPAAEVSRPNPKDIRQWARDPLFWPVSNPGP